MCNISQLAAFLCLILLFDTGCFSEKLGYLQKNLKLENIKYMPDADYFLSNLLYKSIPMHVKNYHGTLELQKLINQDSLMKTMSKGKSRVYKSRFNATTYPVEIRLSFAEFIKRAKKEGLYWDSLLPKSHPIYSNFSLPFCLWCKETLKSKMEYNLLYTFRNASSIFHHDGSENFFYQIKGKKEWFLADSTNSVNAYANDYVLQAGLSPIDPEDVDLNKFPKAANIKFYKVTTEPGDLLFIPEYWWHQVRSLGGENIGVNLWLEYFDFPDSENDINDVVAGVKHFNKMRLQSEVPKCKYKMKNLADIATPSTQHFSLYFGVDDGNIYALNGSDGKIQWSYKVGNDAGSTGVVDDSGDLLFIADENGFVYCFQTNGKVKWSTKLPDGVTSAIRLVDSKVIAASLNGVVYCLNSESGEIIWESGPYPGELWSSPAVYQNEVIICVLVDYNKHNSEVNNVFKIDINSGEKLWEFATTAEIFASPVLAHEKDIVFVTDYTGTVYSLDYTSGKLLWIYADINQPIDSTPVLDTSGVLYLSLNGEVRAIIAANQTLKWITTLNTNDASISSPLFVPALNSVFVASGSTLYRFNAKDGNIIWEFNANDSFMSSPRMDKGFILYIGCNDRYIYALNAKDGKVKWKTKTDGPVVASAAFQNDKMIRSYGGLL